MSRFYSPLRYPGGKNRIFPFVKELLNENHIFSGTYIEPYAGGSGLALRLLLEDHVNTVQINDFDFSIYAFWTAITEDPTGFCDWISDLSVSIDTWQHYKRVQTIHEEHDLVEIAKSTFFLNRTNISGIIKGGPIGGKDQSGKYKIDARFNKDDLIQRIIDISRVSDRISITNFDALEFIRSTTAVAENSFLYLDPPYYQKGSALYMNFYGDNDHASLAHEMSKLRGHWMVSYDLHNTITKLYPQHRKFSYKISQSTSNRVGNEILIFSDDLLYDIAIDHLNSPLAII